MSSNSPGVSGISSEEYPGPNDLDVVMELLANSRRRYVLYCLRNSERPVDSGQLADRIIDSDELMTDRDKRTVLTELRHKHLPKMESVGVIDREDDEIRFDGSDTLVDSYLDLAAELEPAASCG